jgi:hypothetical protein
MNPQLITTDFTGIESPFQKTKIPMQNRCIPWFKFPFQPASDHRPDNRPAKDFCSKSPAANAFYEENLEKHRPQPLINQ